jgi:hypothetical protein
MAILLYFKTTLFHSPKSNYSSLGGTCCEMAKYELREIPHFIICLSFCTIYSQDG